MYIPLDLDGELTSFTHLDNLQLAWQRVLSSTILDTKDRLGLKIFSSNTEGHLKSIRNELITGNYQPSSPRFLYSPKDDKSSRIKTFLDIRDRIVFQALNNVIIENCYGDLSQEADRSIFAHIPTAKKKDGRYSDFTFLPIFSIGNGPGQYDKFLYSIQREVNRAASHGDVWMLQLDVAGFYPSIDHSLLRDTLVRRNWLKNEILLDLLFKCLRVWSALKPGHISGQGVPVGYETSELLATLYLYDIDIDLQLAERQTKMMRFVDDMYFFIEGRANARDFLIEYDLELQQKALIRNSAKTRVGLCTEQILQSKKLEKRLRGDLSYIKNVLYDETEIQTKLTKLVEQITCLGICDEMDLSCIKEEISTIAFLLHRYKVPDERLKQIAICLLSEFPSRSYHASTYLSIFRNDSEVYEALLQIVENPSWYADCRVHCAKAAAELAQDNVRLHKALWGWLTESDNWYLQNASVELLAEYFWEDRDSVPELNLSAFSDVVSDQILYQAFALDKDPEWRIGLINQAFESSSYTSQALGIYLHRRDTSISHKSLNRSKLRGDLEGLVYYSPEEITEFQNFCTYFKSNFGIPLEPDEKFIKHIPDITQANQLLLNMQDAASDPVDFVVALHDFTYQITLGFINTQQPPAYIPQSLLHFQLQLEDGSEEKFIIDKLCILGEGAKHKDYQNVKHSSKADIFDQIKKLFVLRLSDYYKTNGTPVPSNIQMLADVYSKKEVVRDEVFVSYSHENPEWVHELKKYLIGLKQDEAINYWVDEKIAPSQFWRDEIHKAMNRTKVAILLVTQEFLNSTFIRDVELPYFVEEHKKGNVFIIWMLVSACRYKKTALNDIQACHKLSKPLDTLSLGERNQIYDEVANTIQEIYKTSVPST